MSANTTMVIIKLLARDYCEWDTKRGMIQCRERPIFLNLKITNIEIAKDELFDYFIYEFIFNNFFLITLTFKVFDNLSEL